MSQVTLVSVLQLKFLPAKELKKISNWIWKYCTLSYTDNSWGNLENIFYVKQYSNKLIQIKQIYQVINLLHKFGIKMIIGTKTVSFLLHNYPSNVVICKTLWFM